MLSRFLLLLFLLPAFCFSADMSCSSSYVSVLPVCDWSLSCTSQSWCFHGDFGVWGNVYPCNPGGYYDTRPEVSYSCSSFVDDAGLPGSGVPSVSFPVDFSPVEILYFTSIAACFVFSFLVGFGVGGRF